MPVPSQHVMFMELKELAFSKHVLYQNVTKPGMFGVEETDLLKAYFVQRVEGPKSRRNSKDFALTRPTDFYTEFRKRVLFSVSR